jgi:Putative zinc-finger
MTECWAEGELRAYLDRELQAEELQRVAVHLAECDDCARMVAEMSGRALWVGEMMETLSVAETAPKRARKPWRWIAAAAALAAGIAIGVVVQHPREESRAVRVEPAPAVEPAHAAAEAAPQLAAAPKPARRRHIRKPAAPENPFVALDDEPFDTGVVVRMALGPEQVPADVLVGSDGRAHAIRLVNYK